MIIDLRSDTVTQPTPGMKEAMFAAEVGDDVFGEDPAVKKLEKKCASLLGMEAAVFCPSGTMTNQIGIKILTQPYDEVICYKGSHIYKYEGGGLGGNSNIGTKLLQGDRGRISIDEIAPVIGNINDVHQARTSTIALENTVVREAGSYYKIDQIKIISEFSRTKGIHMHMDGARLFNALTETKENPSDFGKYFDTISICLSKGLGAPVGSVLVCKKDLELKARRIRKVFGGAMRQAGYLAAAGIYALDNNIARLKEDHQRARTLGKTLESLAWVKSVMPVDTNIVIFEVVNGLTAEKCVTTLGEHSIKSLAFSAAEIRLVTHLDFTDAMLDKTITVLKKLSFT
ncbi:MAG: threonine aldolase [Bacteroidia bacterium]|nr:threonine aldolase [Bacteroidia bacterium]